MGAVGLGIGVSAVVVPAYLGEVAPAEARGRVVELYELLLCAGMIAATFSFARAAEPGYYSYGDKATPAQIAGWNIDARGDDGAGLPPGKGTVQRGSEGCWVACGA